MREYVLHRESSSSPPEHIHIKTAEDPVLSRAASIVDAVKNLAPEAEAVVYVLSGDVTYSGSEEQFSQALDFVNELKTALQPHLAVSVPISFVAVPGNHDCDFSEATAYEILHNGTETL